MARFTRLTRDDLTTHTRELLPRLEGRHAATHQTHVLSSSRESQ